MSGCEKLIYILRAGYIKDISSMVFFNVWLIAVATFD